MYTYKLVPGSKWSAVGGPTVEDSVEKATPTRAGRYVVGSIAQHISSKRWVFSTIPWGTPMRLNAEGSIEVQLRGKWSLLHKLPAWGYYVNDPAAARKLVEESYNNLLNPLRPKYGLEEDASWPAPWDGRLPKTWVFNDFGPLAVKYFIDYNGNRKLDTKPLRGVKREELLSDFIHTTPSDEMSVILDRQLVSQKHYALSESHGCIHMDPSFMRKWIANKVLAVGATLEVHPYTETTVPESFERLVGKTGKEMHFFPGAKKIALFEVTEKQLGHPLHLPHE